MGSSELRYVDASHNASSSSFDSTCHAHQSSGYQEGKVHGGVQTDKRIRAGQLPHTKMVGWQAGFPMHPAGDQPPPDHTTVGNRHATKQWPSLFTEVC